MRPFLREAVFRGNGGALPAPSLPPPVSAGSGSKGLGCNADLSPLRGRPWDAAMLVQAGLHCKTAAVGANITNHAPQWMPVRPGNATTINADFRLQDRKAAPFR